MWTINLKTYLAILVISSVIGYTAKGKIIYVDANVAGGNNVLLAKFQPDLQYPSIQAAIDAALDGDTIILAAGTFTGNGNRDLDFKGKPITVRSTDPNDPNVVAATIIDCNGAPHNRHRGFYFNSYEDANSILAGITIINGFAPGNWPENQGGGIYCKRSSPTISKCRIIANTSQDFGGGMCNEYSSPTIIDCTFSYNTSGDKGGGMNNRYDSSPTVINCIFSCNISYESGGGMANYSSLPRIVNSTFSGNYADTDGGGMYNRNGNPTLTNCIIWGNSAGEAGNQIWGGTVINYSCIQGGWSGQGNIDADPYFAEPNNGDYHLLSERGRYWPEHDVWVLDKVTSPCIDAGDPYDDPSVEPMPNGDLVNMGAYGGTPYASMSEWALRGDINHDGIVNMIDFSIFADYWLQPSLRAREIDNRLACANNLRALGRALRIYANDYDDQYPTADQWCDLLVQRESDHVTEEMFVCPSAEPGRSHYAINPNVTHSASPPDMVLLFETRAGWNQFGGPELLAPENHQGEASHILFHDGHVEFVQSERLDEFRWE